MYIFKWLLYKCVKYIGLLVSLHLLGYPIVYNIDMVMLYLCLHMYDDILHVEHWQMDEVNDLSAADTKELEERKCSLCNNSGVCVCNDYTSNNVR